MADWSQSLDQYADALYRRRCLRNGVAVCDPAGNGTAMWCDSTSKCHPTPVPRCCRRPERNTRWAADVHNWTETHPRPAPMRATLSLDSDLVTVIDDVEA